MRQLIVLKREQSNSTPAKAPEGTFQKNLKIV